MKWPFWFGHYLKYFPVLLELYYAPAKMHYHHSQDS